jgi:hypothetical protein
VSARRPWNIAKRQYSLPGSPLVYRGISVLKSLEHLQQPLEIYSSDHISRPLLKIFRVKKYILLQQ